jgi:hypothetical protein
MPIEEKPIREIPRTVGGKQSAEDWSIRLSSISATLQDHGWDTASELVMDAAVGLAEQAHA